MPDATQLPLAIVHGALIAWTGVVLLVSLLLATDWESAGSSQLAEHARPRA